MKKGGKNREIVGTRSGMERLINSDITSINKESGEVFPYCNMKNSNCYNSTYWDKCPNFEYYKLKNE